MHTSLLGSCCYPSPRLRGFPLIGRRRMTVRSQMFGYRQKMSQFFQTCLDIINKVMQCKIIFKLTQGPAINDLQTFPHSHNRLLYTVHGTSDQVQDFTGFFGGVGLLPLFVNSVHLCNAAHCRRLRGMRSASWRWQIHGWEGDQDGDFSWVTNGH